MSDLIIGEPDVIRKEDNILWLRAEIERLRALHLERTKTTHKALTERDDEIKRLKFALAICDIPVKRQYKKIERLKIALIVIQQMGAQSDYHLVKKMSNRAKAALEVTEDE